MVGSPPQAARAARITKDIKISIAAGPTVEILQGMEIMDAILYLSIAVSMNHALCLGHCRWCIAPAFLPNYARLMPARPRGAWGWITVGNHLIFGSTSPPGGDVGGFSGVGWALCGSLGRPEGNRDLKTAPEEEGTRRSGGISAPTRDSGAVSPPRPPGPPVSFWSLRRVRLFRIVRTAEWSISQSVMANAGRSLPASPVGVVAGDGAPGGGLVAGVPGGCSRRTPPAGRHQGREFHSRCAEVPSHADPVGMPHDPVALGWGLADVFHLSSYLGARTACQPPALRPSDARQIPDR